jgi:PAS domain S-box-containing protein
VAYVSEGGIVMLVGISRIAPVSSAEEADPSTLPYYVAGFVLTDEFLGGIGESFLIDDLKLVLDSEENRTTYEGFPAIMDVYGQHAGYLVWTPPAPGHAALRSVTTPILLALALFGIIAIAVALRARQIALALARTNDELQQSEKDLARQLNAVAAEKEKIETIVSSIGDGILVVDPEGTIFLSNEAAETLVGRSREGMHGKRLDEVLRLAGDAERVVTDQPLQAIRQMFQTKKTVRIPEASFTQENGTIVVLSMTAAPVDRGKELLGGIIVFHDVTERRLVEAAKRQFISTAAHQLRTPLTEIRWALGSLVSNSTTPLPEEQKDLLARSYDGVGRLAALVNELLSVEHIDSEQMQFNFEPTSVPALIGEMLAELRLQAEHKQVTLTAMDAEALPELPLDRNSMRLVFRSLIENAIHYTPEGGCVTVESGLASDAIVVTVADTGIGIPPAQQERIFSRFFRASNAVRTSPDGSGLGLYIAKQIVARHGGDIQFESREGKGTTFRVTLPTSRSNK